MSARLLFKLDRAGYTGELRASVAAEGGHGALSSDGLGLAASPHPFIIGSADGVLYLDTGSGGISNALIAASRVGDPVPEPHHLTVYQGTLPVLSVRFLPIADAGNVVDVNALLRQGKAQIATAAQLQALADMIVAAQGVVAAYDAAAVELAQERALINTLKLDLTTNAAGLQGLKVRTLANAVTASGKRVLFGARSVNFKLPFFVDNVGDFHIHTARIKNLILGGTLSIPSLTTGAVTATEVTASRVTLPKLSMKPAPADSDIQLGYLSKNGKKIAWIDDTGTFHIRRLGPGVTGYAVWGDGVAVQLASALPLTGVVGLGMIGQRAGDVAARWGAMERLASFRATSVSGGVYTLTLMDSDLSPLYTSAPTTQTGRLGGLRGTLRRGTTGQSNLLTLRGGYYTFVPDGGAPIELNMPHAWLPDNPHRPRSTIIAVGRTELIGTTGDRRLLEGRAVAQHIRSILISLSGRHERYLVVGLYNTATETYGNGAETIAEINSYIASVAGPGFIDPRPAMSRSDGGVWTANGATDPAYLEADGATLSAAGTQRLATFTAAAAQERGMS